MVKTGVREVMGSIPVGDSNFFLSHARDKLNIPSFLLLIMLSNAIVDGLTS